MCRWRRDMCERYTCTHTHVGVDLNKCRMLPCLQSPPWIVKSSWVCKWYLKSYIVHVWLFCRVSFILNKTISCCLGIYDHIWSTLA